MIKKRNIDKGVMLSEASVAVLIEDFFDGRTTLEDEQKLYAYFSSDYVSPLFANYVPLFRGLSDITKQARKAKGVGIRKICWWGISIAAMLAIVFTLGRGFMTDTDLENDVFALYDGSYVIEGGKKITDLSVIVQKLHRAEASSESILPDSRVEVPTSGLDKEMQETISEILNY